jgi:hypothetical protein
VVTRRQPLRHEPFPGGSCFLLGVLLQEFRGKKRVRVGDGADGILVERLPAYFVLALAACALKRRLTRWHQGCRRFVAARRRPQHDVRHPLRFLLEDVFGLADSQPRLEDDGLAGMYRNPSEVMSDRRGDVVASGGELDLARRASGRGQREAVCRLLFAEAEAAVGERTPGPTTLRARRG